MAEDKKPKATKTKVPIASPEPLKPANDVCWIGNPRKRFPGKSNDVDLRHCSKEQLALLKKEFPTYFKS
jgi:hypothetical protein